jgi:WG containing repeat
MRITRRMFLGIVASSAACLGLRGREGFPKWEKEMFSDRAENLLPVRVDGRYGYIDRYGTMIIEPRYELSWGFEDGLAPVRIGGKWGFINTKGAIAIEAIFEDALWFGFGRAPVEMSGRWGAIDSNGDMRIPPVFDCPPIFYEDLASVGRAGWMDSSTPKADGL